MAVFRDLFDLGLVCLTCHWGIPVRLICLSGVLRSVALYVGAWFFCALDSRFILLEVLNVGRSFPGCFLCWRFARADDVSCGLSVIVTCGSVWWWSLVGAI